MNRKQLVVGAVATVIGFILGFFTARIGPREVPVQSAASPPAAGLPQDHPTPEAMEQLAQLQQQAEADPANRQVRVNLGNAFYDIGRFDAAISWYEEALALDPDDVNVNTDLGTARLYIGEVEGAIATYARSLEMEPGHAQTLQNIGIAHYSRGQYTEAIAYWTDLLTRHPDYALADDIRNQIASAREKASQPPSQ